MPRSPSSFVLCGATAPNGSFVNHQQLFGSVCKTPGLRIRSLFLAFLVLYLSWSICSFSWPLRSLFLAFLVLYFSWSFCSLTLAFLFCYGFLAMFWAEIFPAKNTYFSWHFCSLFLVFLVLFLGPFWSLFIGLFYPFTVSWPCPGQKFIRQKIPQCLSREKRVLGEIRNVCLM